MCHRNGVEGYGYNALVLRLSCEKINERLSGLQNMEKGGHISSGLTDRLSSKGIGRYLTPFLSLLPLDRHFLEKLLEPSYITC